MAIYYLETLQDFPNPEEADDEGLLAVGGSLAPDWLLKAYEKGIFPWFNQEDPILWWSPNPRMVLYPEKFKVSKSFRNVLNQRKFRVTYNKGFEQVLDNCGSVSREGQEGTWITTEMKLAYIEMHRLGWAHSVEVWEGDELVGGLYGMAMHMVFFGESMFSKTSNASKVALYYLTKRLLEFKVELIDCQVYTKHLESLGAEAITRNRFIKELTTYAKQERIKL